ncbi:MAG: 50S ribosomal protein L11 methyltransferase [Gammaproteobacteria bacterium]
MSESWLQATVDCPQSRLAALEEIFAALGSLVTWTEAADDEEILEPDPGATPLWDAVRLTALFPPETSQAALSAALPDLELHFATVADRDWDAEWRRSLKPLRFGQRLWVCPAGQPGPDPSGISVTLEPGLAFGTGTHPTTAMCLVWLEAQPLTDTRVLDYGCGSGILAIAALALGARTAVGVDIDPQALTASRENAARNGCAQKLTVVGVADDCGSVDVLVANILSGPLVRLAPELRRYTAPGTRVALSGILSDQAPEVIAAFKPWVSLTVADTQGDWILLAGTVTP